MLTIFHLIEVLDKEMQFGFHYTDTGGSKKITHNPHSKITNLYINGILHLSLQDTDAVIEAYNNIK